MIQTVAEEAPLSVLMHVDIFQVPLHYLSYLFFGWMLTRFWLRQVSIFTNNWRTYQFKIPFYPTNNILDNSLHLEKKRRLFGRINCTKGNS